MTMTFVVFLSPGIISTFLHVHPFGASIEYICSYLQRLDSKVGVGQVGMGSTPCRNLLEEDEGWDEFLDDRMACVGRGLKAYPVP